MAGGRWARRKAAAAPNRLVIGTTVAEQLTTSFFPHLQAFHDAGWELHLVCAPGDWPSGGPPAAAEAVVHRLPMAKTMTPVADARALLAWVRLLRALRPTVVIGASPKGGLLAMSAARIARVPRRIFLHRGARWETLTGASRRVTMAAERATCASATDVVAVSDSLADLVVSAGITGARRRPVVLGPGGSKGVDLRRFQASAPREGAPVLGFVGRLTADKGLDVVLAALAAVRAEHPAARLLVAGDLDPADPPDPAVLAALRADPGVELLGWRRDLEAVYPLFDVLVFPSAREGLPNAVIEAAACGVPTVGWDVTGVTDAVADGVSGRLVPWRNLAAFAAAVRDVADPRPESRLRWRQQARTWAERFDTRVVSQLWVELLADEPR